MTADIEFKGRNVDKAVQNAARSLGLPAEELQYEILSYGATGIFGLAGVKKARILVRSTGGEGRIPSGMHPQQIPEIPGKGMHDQGDSRVESPDNEAARTIAENLIKRMVAAISPEATVAVEQQDNRLRFHIEGGLPGVLIGKGGQTLAAMQLIVEKAVRRVNSQNLRLQVDVEGYRKKRLAGLVQTAEHTARKVAAKGCPSSLGYLNAHDRRLIHLALKQHKDVLTKSIGEGPVRKLMVCPREIPKINP